MTNLRHVGILTALGIALVFSASPVSASGCRDACVIPKQACVTASKRAKAACRQECTRGQNSGSAGGSVIGCLGTCRTNFATAKEACMATFAKCRNGTYLEPTDASVATTLAFLGDGPFVMLNLFRLRDVPDFSKYPELEPETPMTSRELFYQYIAHMDTYLEQVGAERVWLADGGPLLIGPDGERWDVVQMVRYPSKLSFLQLGLLVRGEVGQREAMLSDSRIMPMNEVPLDAVTR